jgi:hypothetical protein
MAGGITAPAIETEAPPGTRIATIAFALPAARCGRVLLHAVGQALRSAIREHSVAARMTARVSFGGPFAASLAAPSGAYRFLSRISGGLWRGVVSVQELQSLRGASVIGPIIASSGS